MIPWWLHPTKGGRFDARHRGCKIRTENGSNWAGYYTLHSCDEPWGTKSWGHLQHRYGVSYPELGVPSRYWPDSP